MATIVMERLGRVFISLQQIRQLPQLLAPAAPPSMPGTVPDGEVPPYFRERYVSTGYRPLGRSWRYYFLSLFRRHNETVNTWTHLLAFLAFLLRLRHLATSVDFAGDAHTWPLLVLLTSALAYSACSAAAHLLGGKSELLHYAFFFLDYVGVAQYQYASALAHWYYAAQEGGAFMPAAAAFSCLSCLGCCYGKLCSHRRPPRIRKLCQVAPSAMSYVWASGPLAARLLAWQPDDAGVAFHGGQVAFFLGSAFFFTVPLLERRLPGRVDFLGQSHQLFHVLLSCCTWCQVEAARLDYLGRRPLYAPLHRRGDAARYVGLYAATLAGCGLIAAVMLGRVRRLLGEKGGGDKDR
ncbi:progestin and adipoQ receptor family member VII, a [Cololabis saira]|uniref:progestin and adipoQ receptor family member VII, a n=1 Tax=Cololabis saira TaxID=129043 RepID=UPI002AD58980|nr:progestin and adipoQ receptor family member VII, a [Cololabis saira]